MAQDQQRVFSSGLVRAVLVGVAIGLLLGSAGCSPGPIIDRLPADLGLPAGAPARPVEPFEYPAVHDMPPPRPTTPLSEDEQVRMEKELQTVRDQQESREGTAKKTGLDTKKKPASANNADGDGAKTSGAKTNP